MVSSPGVFDDKEAREALARSRTASALSRTSSRTSAVLATRTTNVARPPTPKKKKSPVYSVDNGGIIESFDVEVNTDGSGGVRPINSSTYVGRTPDKVSIGTPKSQTKTDSGLKPRFTYSKSLKKDIVEYFDMVTYEEEDTPYSMPIPQTTSNSILQETGSTGSGASASSRSSEKSPESASPSVSLSFAEKLTEISSRLRRSSVDVGISTPASATREEFSIPKRTTSSVSFCSAHLPWSEFGTPSSPAPDSPRTSPSSVMNSWVSRNSSQEKADEDPFETGSCGEKSQDTPLRGVRLFTGTDRIRSGNSSPTGQTFEQCGEASTRRSGRDLRSSAEADSTYRSEYDETTVYGASVMSRPRESGRSGCVPILEDVLLGLDRTEKACLDDGNHSRHEDETTYYTYSRDGASEFGSFTTRSASHEAKSMYRSDSLGLRTDSEGRKFFAA